jgi:hypothetical protein
VGRCRWDRRLSSRVVSAANAEFVLGESSLGLLRRVSVKSRTVCAGIGVRGFTLHLLRRTFLDRQALAGASLNS